MNAVVKIEVGALVRHKAGGPKMLVKEINLASKCGYRSDCALCEWMELTVLNDGEVRETKWKVQETIISLSSLEAALA
jgi:uncharacterized protein YodC (DUF2158 family)